MDQHQYGSTAVNGVLATGLSQAVKAGLQFLSMIILARILMPEDFGLVAAIAPLVAFITLFQDIGLQQSVVQRKEITPDQLTRIFWMMVLLGIGCALVVVLISPGIANFYGDTRLTSLSMVSALPLLINSVGALPMSLMTRNFQFINLSIIVIVANVAGFVAAMAGAYMGIEYWVLVLMPVTIALVTTIGVFSACGWRPDKPRIGLEKEILHFGANLTGFNVLNFFARNLDNILIGRYAGSTQLGYYDFAYKLMLFPIRNINDPVARVIIPILSRVQDDKERLRSIYLRTIGLIALVTVPGIAAVTIVAEEVIVLLMGEKWLPIVPVFSWLGIISMLQVLGNSTGWLFISQGKTKEMFRWGAYSSSMTVVSFLIGLKWGIVGVAAAYTIVNYIFIMPVLYYLLGRIGPVKFRDFAFLQVSLLIAAAITWSFITFIIKPAIEVTGFFLVVLTCLCSYVTAFTLFGCYDRGRYILREAWAMTRRVATKFHTDKEDAIT